MSDTANISKEFSTIKSELSELHEMVDRISRALIGDLEHPEGLVGKVSTHEKELEAMRKEIEKAEVRVKTIEDYVEAMKNKAAGISIGLSLSSAGVGAVISQLLS